MNSFNNLNLQLKVGLCLLIGTTMAKQASAQEAQQCNEINTPAPMSYDFTRELDRWGSQNDYTIADQPHHVRSIRVSNLPIFDETNPDENNLIYRWANRIHFDTNKEVIRDDLLFDVNSVVDDQMLAESERMLRKRKYVGDARIRVLTDCASDVDLEVVTREVWSLTPELSFKSVGGHSSTGIGIRDSNFLGSGQYMALQASNDQERSSWGLMYKNPNIAGSRMMFSSELATNSDGHHYLLESGLPFYAMDNVHAWKFGYESVDEKLNQYAFGERTGYLLHQGRSVEGSIGFSSGLEHTHVQRFSFGLRSETHDLRAPLADQVPMPQFREQLDLFYPFVEYEYLEDRYAQAFNISQISRTEDLMIGRSFRTRLGYAPGNEKATLLKGDYTDTLVYRAGMLLQAHASWDGRWDHSAGQWQDTVLDATLELHKEQTSNRSLYLAFEARKALNLVNGRQLELGGNSGLRGYDNHFLQGDGSLRFTAEQRLFTNYYPMHLLRVGFAGYLDAGKVFGNPLGEAGGVFSNVGLGLRLSPSKSESGQIVHIDLAWPLKKLPGESGNPLLVVQMKKSF